jgi:hypothetical protein
MPRRAPPRRRVALLLALFGALLFSTAADAAGAAKRQRRKRPGSSSSDGNTNSGGKTTTPAKPKASSGGSASGGGGSLDDQINAVRARIRVYRRATSNAVNNANINGTMIFVPNGNASGVSVDYTSKHAGKAVRGKVKATGSGAKASATITASRAQ